MTLSNSDLLIVIFDPLYLVQQVTQISLELHIVRAGLDVSVEMFIVRRLLLQNHRVPSQEVRQSVGSHSAIYIQLVLVLWERSYQIFINFNHKKYENGVSCYTILICHFFICAHKNLKCDHCQVCDDNPIPGFRIKCL